MTYNTSSYASAPGSLILLGEYAVLNGSPAILQTIPYRLVINISESKCFTVNSDRFLPFIEKSRKKVYPKHVKLIRSIINNFYKCYNVKNPVPLQIDIKSEIDPNMGFGSSAALIAATLKALAKYYLIPCNLKELFTIGKNSLIQVCARGSGADIAAALGDYPICIVDVDEKIARPFSHPFEISAIYTGNKTPTEEVLKQVWGNTQEADRLVIFSKMKEIIVKFITHPALGLVESYQNCMQELGVSSRAIERAIWLTKAENQASKISGSGLGDCVIIFSLESDDLDKIRVPKEFIFFTSKELKRNEQ